MISEQFLQAIQAGHFENAFNPYTDHCEVSDKPNAADIRSENLLSILNVAQTEGIDDLWVGRDLGYRGGRRTGLPFTDDFHISDYSKRWGVDCNVATIGNPVKEQSATVVWNILNIIKSNIFLWNIFPLHPYPQDNQLSNRKHNSSELEFGKRILKDLCELLKPKSIICIGNDAYSICNKLILDSKKIKVRHPSYGGKKEFESNVKDIYNL